MITVTFHCGGCNATALGSKMLERRFIGTRGNYGFGGYIYDTARDAVPEGWLYPCIAGCAYCPTCKLGLADTAEARP